ncbi:dihydroorotase family protein [Bradyrhizobium sp. NP1]|uniref:dihydroorotase n=1 Tax=Bradyrhizobium sp. NP1 TaxID=3049772 RepID=UPI0025A6118C|nr:dihydroorotase family protein [Bradyrhizobium sp. NP1]WJR75810.1 dihydroorotase family protein [Bradyrhizobium sp. NP1]
MADLDLVLAGGKVATPQGLCDASVGVQDGRIVFISTGQWTPKARQTVDVSGKVVVPGFIDTHVHFRDPGLTYKEDFATGTRAAAAGGITTVVDMPNNKPAINRTDAYIQKRDDVRAKAMVDYALYAGATKLDQIPGMLKAGAIGVKIFMVTDPKSGYPHDPELFTGDDGVLYDTLKVANSEGTFCAVHPTNQEIFTHESKKKWDAGTTTPDDFVEAYFGENCVSDHTAMATLIEMVRASRARLHVLHLRSETGVMLIQRAKQDGLPITMEVNPKYVLHTSEDMKRMGPLCTPYGLPDAVRMNILRDIERGFVDVLGSDHAPHTREELEPGWKDAWRIPFGNPQLDHFVSALLTYVDQGILSLQTLVRTLAENPARLIGVYPKKGAIQVGSDADFAVLDLGAKGTFSNDGIQTKVGWSPYAGRAFTGRPVMTISRGRIVMRDGAVVGEPGWGQYIDGAALRAQ